MSDYLKKLGLCPAVAEGEWKVRLSLASTQGCGTQAHPFRSVEETLFLSPTEAKDLSQRLFHLSLEISEREGAPQGDGETVGQLRAQLREERQKRVELTAKVAPKDKLEAAKNAVQVALDGGQWESGLSSKERSALEAALAWLNEFKAVVLAVVAALFFACGPTQEQACEDSCHRMAQTGCILAVKEQSCKDRCVTDPTVWLAVLVREERCNDGQ